MADLEVSVTEERGIWVVTVVGDVDESNAAKLRDALDRVLANGESRLVVDLCRVSFMDSTGLGILVGRLKVVRARRGAGGDVAHVGSLPQEPLGVRALAAARPAEHEHRRHVGTPLSVVVDPPPSSAAPTHRPSAGGGPAESP